MEKISILGVKETIYKEVLDNGLEVIMYPMKNVSDFSAKLTTKYGNDYVKFKHEGDSKWIETPFGVAHFLEHLTFHMDGYEAMDVITKDGNYSNAYTNSDCTTYVLSGTINYEKDLAFLLKYVFTPYYTSETVEKERGIIREEAKRSFDNVDNQFYYNCKKAIYKNNHHRDYVTGSVEDVDNITIDDITNAYNTFYKPSNMFLVICGSIDVDKSLDIIKSTLNEFDFKNEGKVVVEDVDEQVEVYKHESIIEDKVNIIKTSVSFKMPFSYFSSLKLSTRDLYRYLHFIFTINFGATSDFAIDIENNNIAPSSPSVYVEIEDNFFIGTIEITTNKDKEYIELLKKYISNISVDEQSIIRKRNSVIGNYIMHFDDSNDVNHDIGSDILMFGDYAPDEMEKLNNLDINMINKIIKLIDKNNYSIIKLVPKKK